MMLGFGKHPSRYHPFVTTQTRKCKEYLQFAMVSNECYSSVSGAPRNCNHYDCWEAIQYLDFVGWKVGKTTPRKRRPDEITVRHDKPPMTQEEDDEDDN